MSITVKILRKEHTDSTSYEQTFIYEGDTHITIEHLLQTLNDEIILESKDRPICWKHSCQQGICGACAVVVNGVPKLTCQTYCDEVLKKDSIIYIKPLSKFRVISDLKVDHSPVFKLVKDMELWLNEKSHAGIDELNLRSKGASCIMCGCCLEVCPNYSVNESFSGMLGTAAITNLTFHGKERMFQKQYKNNVFEGCTKSLACQRICPMNIPMIEMLSQMNRRLIWKMKK